jgi:phosphonate transport system substrate-binding protein
MERSLMLLSRCSFILLCSLGVLSSSIARAQPEARAEEGVLKIGVGAMISPKSTFNYYVDMVNYVGDKMGLPARMVQRKTYAEMNGILKSKDIDLSFVCSGPYVEGRKDFGMELLVAPVVNGVPVYYADIIVHKDSALTRLEDLEGKKFAFTDPDSNTGRIVPTYMVGMLGKTPETFFKKYIFTYSHDNSIAAVASRVVDGASVDSLIYDYIKAKYPELVADTKVIARSPAYGIPPIVVHPDTDPAKKEKLREIFLHMHEDPKGQKILKGIMIDRFIVPEDAAYDSVRAMQQWLKDNNKE